MITTQKEIRLKDGVTLPVGLPVEFIKTSPSICLVQCGDLRPGPARVRVTSAFQCPTLEELEGAVSDGVCESVGGDSVEPDGWDSEGSPSWLLALGMI